MELDIVGREGAPPSMTLNSIADPLWWDEIWSQAPSAPDVMVLVTSLVFNNITCPLLRSDLDRIVPRPFLPVPRHRVPKLPF